MKTVLGCCVLFAVVLIRTLAPVQADPPEVTWGEKIEVASGGGYRGPWRMNESEQLGPARHGRSKKRSKRAKSGLDPFYVLKSLAWPNCSLRSRRFRA